MAEKEVVRVSGDLHHCFMPAFRYFGQESFAEERIVHDGNEVVFSFDIVIEAHGADVQFLGDAAHGDSLKAFFIGYMKRCGGDGFAAEICGLS